MKVAAATPTPTPGLLDRVNVNDLVLLLGFLSGTWAWVRRVQRRRRQERLRVELRDEALLLVMQSLYSTLALMAVRPCMVGDKCTDDAPDTEAHSKVSVVLDRLDTMSKRMARALGKDDDGNTVGEA